jgi:hypothetical protein
MSDPVITFHRVLPQSVAPVRGDKSALGTLPTAGFQYCEALRLASSFGWLIFPPTDFFFQFDGVEILWTHPGAEGGTWFPLQSDLLEDTSDSFDAVAPEGLRGYAPPVVSRSFVPGIVQIWSGLFVKTKPGWSLLIRPPANHPKSRNYQAYEGIIETDEWFGPLFINIALMTTDRPVEVRRDVPLMQVQALPREVYADATLNAFEVDEQGTGISDRDWEIYRRNLVKPSLEPGRRLGRYATESRKRHSKTDKGD